jgi:hypothetical protein
MKRRASFAFAAALAATLSVGCARTTIRAANEDKADDVYVPEGGCNVREFPTAAELPAGSKNIGWVSVEDQGDDDASLLALRQKICSMGGDAFSQVGWVREINAENHVLKANAWSLP